MIIPIPTEREEPEPEIRNHEWFKWYLDVQNWKCPKCGSQNFGRNKFCAYCRGRLAVVTPRPEV